MSNDNCYYNYNKIHQFNEIDQIPSAHSRNQFKSEYKHNIPRLNFKPHMSYYHESNSFAYTISNDFFSRNNHIKNKCEYKGNGINDNYTSTKIDSKSRGSKIITSPRGIGKDKNSNKLSSRSQFKHNGDIGTRLYNYGFYIKKKIETKKKDEEKKMIKRMKPKTNKTLIIEWDYPAISLKRSKQSLTKDNNDFCYQPNLNKHSLYIAKQLEPSLTRLTKKRKRYKSKDSYLNYKTAFELSYDYNRMSNSNRSHLNHSMHKSKSIKVLKRIDSMYANAIDQLKKRSINYETNKRLKDEEYKLFPFKPNVTQYSMSTINLYNNQIRKAFSNKEHYLKQVTWKNKLEKKNQLKRDKKENEALSNCTFSPKIERLSIENDEKMIQKNINQMNEYVVKRRNELNKLKEDEEYKNKRFFTNNSTFQIKTTYPKEFIFHSKNEKKRCCREISNNSIFFDIRNKPSIYKRVTIKKENNE